MILASPDTKAPAHIHTPEYYERLLNPDKTLPEVKLYQDRKSLMSDETQTTWHYFVLNKNNFPVGGFMLSTPINPGPNSAALIQSMSIRVGQHEFAKQGLGKATYLAILKSLGDTKLNSGEINDDSRKIWEWLVEKKVAKQVNTDTKKGEFETI